MPATTDHNRRDGMAAAYAEIQLELGKHRRRLFEAAKAHIDTKLARAADTGEPIDGTALGREAAAAALNFYLGPDGDDAIEGAPAAAGEIEPAPDA